MKVYLLVEHEDYGQPIILGAYSSLDSANQAADKWLGLQPWPSSYHKAQFDTALDNAEEQPCSTWQGSNGVLYICYLEVQA